jgi:hypothetical protein
MFLQAGAKLGIGLVVNLPGARLGLLQQSSEPDVIIR